MRKNAASPSKKNKKHTAKPEPLPQSSTSPLPRRWSAETYISLGLIVLTLAAFLPTCSNDFVDYDDPYYVTENPHVRTGLTSENIAWAWAERRGNWHPLTWWSLQLDAEFYPDLNPAGFHFTNAMLHTLSVVLLFWVFHRMTGALWPSALVAAVFALHPLRVESVAWVAERKDVLCTFFGMLTLLAYQWYVQGPRLGRYLLLVLAFALGLMAKSMLVTLPFVLLLLDYWPLGRLQRGTLGRLVLEKLPLFALAAAVCIVTMTAQQEAVAVRTLEQFPMDVRLGNALLAYVQYLGMFLWPSRLAVFYPHPHLGLFTLPVLGAGALLAAITVLAVRHGRQRPYFLVGWLWYLGMLVPVIGLVQVGAQGLADRYTYLPLVGITFTLVWGLAELAGRSLQWKNVLAVGGIVALCVLLLCTWQQERYWKDTVSLWQRALDVTTNNYMAHVGLARALRKQDKDAEALAHLEKALPISPDKTAVRNDLGTLLMKHRRFEEAWKHFAANLQFNPQDAWTHNNIGSLLLQQFKPAEAVTHLRIAVQVQPDIAEPHFNLALSYAILGQVDEAKTSFAQGQRLAPGNVTAYYQFGILLRNLGHPDQATPYLARAVQLDPNNPVLHYDLGVTLAQQRQFSQVLGHYQRAVQLNPNSFQFLLGLAHACQATGQTETANRYYQQATQLNPDWPALFRQRTWQLATHPEAKLRNGLLAVLLGEQLCQATAFNQPEFLDALAAAYAEVGRFDEAVNVARKALTVAPPTQATALRDRLQLYENRQPFRSSQNVQQ